MARFYEKLTKPTALADGDIFVISVGSGTSWIDYKITYSQLKDVIKTISDMQNYYTKSQTYTQAEVNAAISSAIGAVYKPSGSKTCAELVSSLLIAANKGNVYNITDSGVTTEDFVDGAGKTINAGDNVSIVEVSTDVFKFDLLSGFIDLTGYQTKNLASAIEGQTTVEGALAALSANKANLSEVYTKTQINDDFVKKSATAGLLKNDGSVDTNTYVPAVTGKGLSTEDYTSLEKSKLAGISDGATKTEASATNGHIEIDDVDVTVYDDSNVKAATLAMNDTVKSTDTTPFLYRPIPPLSTPYVREKLVGASMAWNQIIPKTAATETKQGVTFTNNDDGSWTLTGTPDNNNCVKNLNYETNKWTLLPNHIYYARAMSGNNKIGIALCGNDGYDYGGIKMVLNEEKIIKLSAFLTVPSTWCRLQIANLTDVNIGTVTFSPQVIDLTLAFGTAIANRIYSMEQTEAGSGIAWIKSYGFFTDDYYANDAGSIQSVCADRKEIVGFNQWDEEWEVGGIDSNGQNEIRTDRIRSKNYISVIPNINYYSNLSGGYFGYDSNKNFVSSLNRTNEGIISIPDNVRFIRFRSSNSYGTVYNHDICVNISDTVKNGTYEPYHKTTISLGHDELRGVMKLDANNNLVYYGDEKASDGTVTRKFGIVDMGTLDWLYTNNRFQAGISDSYRVSSSSVKANIICPKYVTVSADDIVSLHIGIAHYTNSNVWVYDPAYTDAATFKTAMSGVYLVYELATPTTEQSTPFESPQYLFDGGTEEFVDYGVEQETRDVAVPVGHVTEYMGASDGTEIKDKFYLPTLPSDDGIYDLNCLIQNGAIKEISWRPLELFAKKIADCEDVEITDLQAGDSLVWDATAGKWKNQQSTSMVVYDDTEQVIGTWFGETLYEKTIDCGYLLNNAMKDVSVDISNLGIIYKISGIMVTDRVSANVPYLGTWNTGTSDDEVGCYYTSGILHIKTRTDRTAYRCYITLQYTKTTPTLLMSTPTEEFTPADESESTDENR